MKFRMNGDSASSLALIAVTSRVFFGTVIDLPGLFCAGWLATLLGALIANTGCVREESLADALHKVIPARKADLFDLNMQALQAGKEFAG